MGTSKLKSQYALLSLRPRMSSWLPQNQNMLASRWKLIEVECADMPHIIYAVIYLTIPSYEERNNGVSANPFNIK